MPKKTRRPQKPLTPEQEAKKAAGIAAAKKRREEREAATLVKTTVAFWSSETGDKCRELQPEEIRQQYTALNDRITTKVDEYTKADAVTQKSFDELIPDLDIMHAMLSQRGRYRKVMNTLHLPSWGKWYYKFRQKSHIDYTLKTVQRRLKKYRGEVGTPPKPEPSIFERLFLLLSKFVPANCDGEEHVLVSALTKVTAKVVDHHGADLDRGDLVHLDYCIKTLEEAAEDFEAYAVLLKEGWTGRDQWLQEEAERQKQHNEEMQKAYQAKNPMIGEVINNAKGKPRIKVWATWERPATDGSHLFLVEKFTGKDKGTAALWRTCDIRRLKEGKAPKVNGNEIWWRNSWPIENVEKGRTYKQEDLAHAQERLDELKAMDCAATSSSEAAVLQP